MQDLTFILTERILLESQPIAEHMNGIPVLKRGRGAVSIKPLMFQEAVLLLTL